MFFNTPGEPTNWKRKIYLTASTVLGIELGVLAYSMVVDYYFKNSDSRNLLMFSCFVLVFLGAIGGFFLGKLWWRKLYIERVWVRK